MTSPDPARWARLKTLFEAVLDLPPADREPLIAGAGLDAAALTELRSLLTHHDLASREQGFMAGAAAPPWADPASRVGQRLGAWEIVRPIGVGA